MNPTKDTFAQRTEEGRVAPSPSPEVGCSLVTTPDEGGGDTFSGELNKLTEEIRDASRERDARALQRIGEHMRGVALRMSNRLASAAVMGCVGILNAIALQEIERAKGRAQ